ncbi:hypothetical protein J1N35_008376 [Gossypium stocksii]|uniref:Uncharacterized protein n=1 Tax=Gossypium stocksii TaxID=47602 RepID=A0A9D3W963_9ROSI|nr:hypothetical protein J1N35_008376 [Gossypium stocksii]
MIPNGWQPIGDNNGADTVRPCTWSSKPSRNLKSGTNPLMIIVGADDALIGDPGIVCTIEESLGESTILSREIDEYMDVWLFMKNVRGSLSSTFVGEGSAASRKKQKKLLLELPILFWAAKTKVAL